LPNDLDSYEYVLAGHCGRDFRTSATALCYSSPLQQISTQAIESFLEDKFCQTTSRDFWTELKYLGLSNNTLKRKHSCERLGKKLPTRRSAFATPNQVLDVIVRWDGDATDPMEIDLLDPSYSSDYYIAKMLSWLVNIDTGLTERLTAMEKLVSELVTRDCLATAAFPG
jgi:hypothetical protein